MNGEEVLREIRGGDAERLLLLVTQEQASYSPREARELFGGDDDRARSADKELEHLGLVSSERSMAGEITATPRGRALASRIRDSRRNGPDRWDRVTRAVVESLISTGAWKVDEVDGQPVSDGEERIAISSLERWGLVKTHKNANDEFHHVAPTDRIHEVPGIHGHLRDNYEGRFTYSDNRNTTTIHGSTVGAVQTGGAGNTQKVRQTLTPTQQAEALQAVGALLAILEQAESNDVGLREAVEAIEAEVRQDDSTAATVKSKVMDALIVAGASETGQLVAHGLAQLLAGVAG